MHFVSKMSLPYIQINDIICLFITCSLGVASGIILEISIIELNMRKCTFSHVRPTKTQIRPYQEGTFSHVEVQIIIAVNERQ